MAVHTRTLQRQLQSIDKAILKATPSGKRRPSLDGVVDAEDYCKARYRILFLAKEPHVPSRTGVDEYREYARKECKATEPKKRGNPFMDPLKYIAYAILNGFPEWDDVEDANKCLAVFKACCSIALINLSKTPGPARSIPKKLSADFAKFRPFVLRQIAVLDPHIIVCLGTMATIGADLGFQEERCIREGHAEACKNGGRILVKAYHPVQSTISQEQYCNDVIVVIRRQLNSGWSGWARRGTRASRATRRPAPSRG